MALKGQGDPRWIVEGREDGRNVNQWHWEETDFTAWAKKRLQELLGSYHFEDDDIDMKLSGLTVKGEVSINTRKKKTILFYELDVSIKWEAELKKSQKTAKGTIEMPYISEENDDDDFEVKIRGDDEDDPAKGSGVRDVKDEVRRKIISVLKQKVPQMLRELRDVSVNKTNMQIKETPSTKVLDKIEVPAPSSLPPPTTSNTNTTSTPTPSNTASSSKSRDVVKGVSFTQKEKFVCSAQDLFLALMDQNRVRAYAGPDAEVSREKGGKFRLFGGSLSGENIEVEYPKKIVQQWRFSSWPADHYSTVKIELEEKNGKTHLTLTHSNVPEEDREHTERGWPANFWNRIKGIFGYGGML